MARFSAENRYLVVAGYLLLTVLCGGLAAALLRAAPDTSPRVTLDRASAAVQAELDRRFPGVEQTFMAVVGSRDADQARAQAVALSTSLAERTDLFQSVFVPGVGPFYDANLLLFHDAADVTARVDAALQMQPLYQALAAAPDIDGLATLVSEIGRAVQQGRSPPALETVLFAAATTMESAVRGPLMPVDWRALAGLGGETGALRWFVLATPQPGLERQAARFAASASQGMQEVGWLWPRRSLGGEASPMRDFVVPGGLSAFVTLTLLAAGLGSVRRALALLAAGGATLAVAAAVAATTGGVLDGITWSFAAAVLAPVFVCGTALVVSQAAARSRGAAALPSVMLAAQRRGGLVSAFTFLFLAFWISWLVRQLPSLSLFAMLAVIGTAMAWLVCFTLLPAALVLLDAGEPGDEPHWLDEALDAGGSSHARNASDVLATVVLAAALFAAVFLPAVRFGERHIPSDPPPFLDTPDSRGAVHLIVAPEEAEAIVARISALPEVGAIRTIAQFMPPGAAQKAAELRRLQAFQPLVMATRGVPDETALAQSFAELDRTLAAIAASSASAGALRQAALRLRRAAGLFVGAGRLTRDRVGALEEALFGRLPDLSRTVAGLAAAAEPTVNDLDPWLRRRFVSDDGLWRIEVMPKPGTGLLTFGAALRRTMPDAAGEPVAALVRNEVIHHETLLALGAAAVAASILVLAALRSIAGWVVSLVPVSAFVTLTAALSVLLDVSLNTAMLAGASAIAAMLISSAMIAAQSLSAPDAEGALAPGPAMRAALVPPVAMAGAVAPLALSPSPPVSELGAVLAVMLLAAATLCAILVPVLSRWLKSISKNRAA